ncbi:hypothetical protein lerEdw1_019777 [Lerista edwardsae]|nr:hypothetical protein lerEdw1_019777 [Lerista edwardsae]
MGTKQSRANCLSPSPAAEIDLDDRVVTHRQITVLIIGAGSRGKNNCSYALCFPDRMRVIGVADPHAYARKRLQEIHDIDKNNVFDDWKAAAEREKFADAVIIATPDRLHKEPAVAFAQKGYHILLEKPMAVTPEDCKEIVQACQTNNIILAVGHVYRYHPVSTKIKELLDAGVIGDVCHIQHLEPVGFWHFAHSYVRGNWRNEAESSFSLLTKSCHDIDLIHFWMGGKRCLKVSAFGNCSHFTKEHKGYFGWPVSVVCSNGEHDIESLTEVLRHGPYGKCVYECDNDVASHQAVNMEFEGGATAAFTMMGFSYKTGVRKTTIYGTKGELFCEGSGPVVVHDFLQETETKFPPRKAFCIPLCLSAHSGGDYYLMESFALAVAENNPSLIKTGPEETLRSHLLVFEAERSRKENRVVCLET